MANPRTEEGPLARDNVRKDGRLNKEIVMKTKSAFSAVGLAHKVCLSAEGQGYTPELLNALAEHPDLFRQFRQVQLGRAFVTVPEHVIDCDAAPYVPEGLEVVEHRKGGKFKFDAKQVKRFLVKNQKRQNGFFGPGARGHDLRIELASKPVLNANVLDCLIANQYLIPEGYDWSGLCFWGTIYLEMKPDYSTEPLLCVRHLVWNDVRKVWTSSRYHLDELWFDDKPTALLKC